MLGGTDDAPSVEVLNFQHIKRLVFETLQNYFLQHCENQFCVTYIKIFNFRGINVLISFATLKESFVVTLNTSFLQY